MSVTVYPTSPLRAGFISLPVPTRYRLPPGPPIIYPVNPVTKRTDTEDLVQVATIISSNDFASMATAVSSPVAIGEDLDQVATTITSNDFTTMATEASVTVVLDGVSPEISMPEATNTPAVVRRAKKKMMLER